MMKGGCGDTNLEIFDFEKQEFNSSNALFNWSNEYLNTGPGNTKTQAQWSTLFRLRNGFELHRSSKKGILVILKQYLGPLTNL